MTKKLLVLAAALAVAVLPAAGARADHHGAKDIVDTAVAAGNFKTLAKALQAAGLVETLKGEGPFTVFAPTDAAFEKLPAGTVEDLLKPENREQLQKVLTYHVVPGRIMSSDLTGKTTAAATVEGSEVEIDASEAQERP